MTTSPKVRAVTERRTLTNHALNAAVVGAVSTSVLRWNAAGTVNSGLGGWPLVAWATEINDANLGTVVKILRRGVYHVILGATLLTGNNTAAGISRDAPAATLLNTAVPINTTAGIVQGAELLLPAATQFGWNLTASIYISDAMAGDVARGIIRFHATAGGEGGPPTGLVLGTVDYQIVYVGDMMGV